MESGTDVVTVTYGTLEQNAFCPLGAYHLGEISSWKVFLCVFAINIYGSLALVQVQVEGLEMQLWHETEQSSAREALVLLEHVQGENGNGWGALVGGDSL